MVEVQAAPQKGNGSPREQSSKTKLPRATHGDPSRPLRLGEIEIPCFVLEGEIRILAQAGVISSLDMSLGSGGKPGYDRLASFAAGKTLNPFMPKGLSDMINNPIRFIPPHGGIALAYQMSP